MSHYNQLSERDLIDTKIHGDRWAAFWGELFGNSGHFLILKSMSDITLHGMGNYLTDATEYLLIGVMLLQSWYLSRQSANRFFGNLIGVCCYTIIDLQLEGASFFSSPSHITFWTFSLLIASLQGMRDHWHKSLTNWILPLESIIRSLMVVAFYAVTSLKLGETVVTWNQISEFANKTTHLYLILSLTFIGSLLGFLSLQTAQQRDQLQKIAQTLRNLAEWGMGTHVVNTAVSNPKALNFQRCDRTILFMDIRKFTNWCEQTDPNLVATVLNDYYGEVEPIAAAYQPLRISFTADEIMAIYESPAQGLSAARAMQESAQKVLAPYALGVGCAIHSGSVIEGLFGSQDVRTYTAIGDVVNTAKRLEGTTPAGAITISEPVYVAITNSDLALQVHDAIACEPVLVKGKQDAIAIWRIFVGNQSS
ncbi:adenylate/guanylate cyclase domain-containing protein [Pseudanabaena mucicola]|uniref:Adenylate/guanylate cyclase domain-containing protein n=1 Tax=Pseudanabaena mucicola FACHB-723 TaxID=2692860 RepID=A0ABR7ZUZ6_9CYAN|nr:adenylate/guanylate cyclase domain-containing protein [Pseudanabaena mucicola]MBD2187228.1 adenylate/guanylate cyclase domain-containing protein [Pseudanabaena mucicola FACHB-723]